MFTTERLILRPTAEGDADFMFELMNTQSWIQFIGDRGVHSEGDAKNYISKNITTQYDRLGYASFTLIRKKDDMKMGVCGLYDRESVVGIDLGFALLPPYEGKGYAAEASECLIQAAKEKFNLKELSAITISRNTRSKNLLKRLGFEYKEVKLSNEEELELWKIKL